jgi:GDPmannose 4,6-dehydratase
MSKIALITGITGQDGSYLAELLLQKKYVVHGLIRKKTFKNSKFFWPLKHVAKNLKLHKLDFHNFKQLDKYIKKINPDEVYHLAAQAHDGHSFKNELYTLNINLNFTHKILSSVRKINPKANFFFAGSSEMYSKNIKVKIDENTNFNPESAYGIAKVASHYLIKNYRENFNFKASTGILFNHESPRKDDRFVLRKIAKSVAKIKLGLQNTISLGDIKSKRDWGHAKDYAYAMWLINIQKKPGDYIIGTGKLNSVKNFVEKAFKYVGLDYKKHLKIDKKLIRIKDSKARIANPMKLMKKLKWKRKFNFESLVIDMVDKELNNLNYKR